MVVLVNATLLIMLMLGFFMHAAWLGAAVISVSKIFIDFVALWKATGRQHNREAMKFFLPAQIIYLFIILFSAWHAFVGGGYEWKGREVS
jgi:hypothetical protein